MRAGSRAGPWPVLRVPVEGAHQPAVDQHQAVDVLVSGAALEVPCGVGRSGRGAQRVPAEIDLATALARRLDHLAGVLERDLQPPLRGVLVVLNQRLVVLGDRASEDPVEVVVERIDGSASPSSTASNIEVSSSACERRSSAQTCRSGRGRDDVLREKGEVTGAADGAGDQDQARGSRRRARTSRRRRCCTRGAGARSRPGSSRR